MSEAKQNVTMPAKDTLSANLAECYVKIGERRDNLCRQLMPRRSLKKTKTGKRNRAIG